MNYKFIPDNVYNPAIGDYGKIDLYIPETAEKSPVVLYFHGGGIEGGDRKCDDPYYKYLAENGIAVAAADYRLYPQAKFPEFITDAADAAKWLSGNLEKYGFGDMYIGGSSAGSYLTMMLFFDKRFFAERNLKFTDFAGYFFDAGQPTVHYNVLRERGEDTRLVRLDEAAPLYFITEDYDTSLTLPKIKIITADDDMPCRMDQNRLLKSALINFSYPPEKISFTLMEGYGHCGYDGEFRDGKSLLGEMMIEFINI